MKTLERKTRTVTVYVGLAKEARALGISHTHLRHILDGNRRPSDELRERMIMAGFRFDTSGMIVHEG